MTNFIFGEPVNLTLEEAFPTATPQQLKNLRTEIIPSVGLRVTAIDHENGTMTVVGVQNPMKER